MAEEKSGLSTTLPWVALGVGVVGIGAAAWQERNGSGSAAVDLKHRTGSRAVIPRARVKFGPYRPPSLEEIRIALRKLGMKVRREEGEFRVVFDDFDATPRGQLDEEMAAYYTLDAEDALKTARDMARRRGQEDF